MTQLIQLITFPWIAKVKLCGSSCSWGCILRLWWSSFSKFKVLIFRLRVFSCARSESNSVRRRNYHRDWILSCLIYRLWFSGNSWRRMLSRDWLSIANFKITLLKVRALLSCIETNLSNVCAFLWFPKSLNFQTSLWRWKRIFPCFEQRWSGCLRSLHICNKSFLTWSQLNIRNLNLSADF